MLMHKLKIHHCVMKGMLWLTGQQFVHHLLSGRNGNSEWHLRASPSCSSTSSFTLTHTPKNPPPISISIALSLSPSIISIHLSLVETSQRGLGCCMQGILGPWRQFGNEACLHFNSMLSGYLVNLMRGGLGWWWWGGGGAEKANGETATLGDRRVNEGVRREHWLI